MSFSELKQCNYFCSVTDEGIRRDWRKGHKMPPEIQADLNKLVFYAHDSFGFRS